MRAWAHFSLRQDSQAVTDEEAAFKLKPPSDYREFMNYSSYLRRVKRYQDSLKALRSAEEIELKNGSVSMMTQYNLGWTLFELERYEEAVKAFTLGIPKQPDYPFAYWRRGLAHEAMGKKTLAKSDFESAGRLFVANKDKWKNEDLKNVRDKFIQYGIEKKYPI
jgi:tetratricopeptide (TPR) repeat protein